MSLVPDLLTIEEAARVLRIGRTKAYAMGQEWRITEGQSGLMVREFGGQLRVPRVWIEEQLGAPLRSIPQRPANGNAIPTEETDPTPSHEVGPTSKPEAEHQELQLLPNTAVAEPSPSALKPARAKRRTKPAQNVNQLTFEFD